MNYLSPKSINGPKRFVLLSVLISVAQIICFEGASFAGAAFCRERPGIQLPAFSFPGTAGGKAAKALAKGKFLVAGRRLMGPNFGQTVILLIRHGADGAMGLVINRPLQVKLSTVFPDIKELSGKKENLYLGGPVEPTAILLLTRSAKPPQASTAVFGDVYLSYSPKVLRRLIEKPDQNERFRIYAGYAGWAPGQLEAECDRGDWHVLDADAEILFDRNAPDIWQELIQRVSVKWVRINF